MSGEKEFKGHDPVTARPIELERRADGAFVPGELHARLKPADLLLVERAWSPVRLDLMTELSRVGLSRRDWPQSLHWDWSQKAAELARLDATGIGIFAEGRWQGLMLTRAVPWVARLPEDSGKPLIYIDYLESAPWNWPIPALGRKGEYKGIGAILFREAILLSIDEEFRGRVGLHSLPQAEEFYRTYCGMADLGPDRTKQNLRYFEFSRKAAEAYLQAGGDG
jgi:hypothetical protein